MYTALTSMQIGVEASGVTCPPVRNLIAIRALGARRDVTGNFLFSSLSRIHRDERELVRMKINEGGNALKCRRAEIAHFRGICAPIDVTDAD